MDEDWKALAVRLDTRGFAADLAALRSSLEGTLGDGADRAGRRIEGSLLRAVRTGKLGFDELRAAGLSALDAIAAGALRAGLSAVLGGSRGGGLGQVLAGVLASGLPGRATGGPVSPARPYLVGERGPELFVPTAAGRVEPGVAAGPREVRVAITVQGPAGTPPEMLRQSSRQVARAVRAALEG
jgi:hypothetical protein